MELKGQLLFSTERRKMTITKEYIEGLKSILEDDVYNSSENLEFLVGYLQGLINLYEVENDNTICK